MKLWKIALFVVVTLAVASCGPVVTRRNHDDIKIKTESGNKGNKIFLLNFWDNY